MLLNALEIKILEFLSIGKNIVYVKNIAEDLGICTNTAHKYVKRLAKKGYLKISIKGVAGGTTNDSRRQTIITKIKD